MQSVFTDQGSANMAFPGSVIPAKRLATDISSEDSSEPQAKRPALESNSVVGKEPSQAAGEKDPSPPTAFSPERLARAQEIIRKEFGTEILLKHNELRLIDTEIAKCQAALEQIRRASMIPYPSQTGRVQDMVNVSTGSGAALIPPGMQHPPSHPAPWGVTDGPYSRHYASWLIPAPEFDGGLPAPRLQGARGAGLERRSRGNYFDETILTSSRSRAQRGSHSTRLQALPLGYPQPRGSRGPLTLKRHSDNKWVKLVCQNCHREDFSSVQGFINHCRISHTVHYTTHEDAAKLAGTEEGVDQETGEVSGAAAVVQQPRTASIAAAASSSAQAASGGGSGSSNLGGNSQLVHKYNRAGVKPQSLFPHRKTVETAVPTITPPSAPSSFRQQRERPRRPSNMGPPVSPGFVPCASTPHLSSLFAKSGRAGNLEALVKDARTKEDTEGLASPTTPDGLEALSPVLTPRHAQGKHQVQGGLSAPSSVSMKGRSRMSTVGVSGSNLAERHGSSSNVSAGDNSAVVTLTSPSPLEHSPSTVAVDTNQAPSLISDDGQSGSDGEGEEDDFRPGQGQPSEHQALISSLDGEDDLLPHEATEGKNSVRIEEKPKSWKQRGGDPRPSDRRHGPRMQT